MFAFTELEIQAIKSASFFSDLGGWGIADGMSPEAALAKVRGATFKEVNSYLDPPYPPKWLAVAAGDNHSDRIALKAWKDLCRFLDLPFPTHLNQQHVTILLEKYQKSQQPRKWP